MGHIQKARLLTGEIDMEAQEEPSIRKERDMKIKKQKDVDERIYSKKINFGRKSFVEFLMTKTKVFKEFQEMSAFITSILKASNYPFFVVDTDLNIQYMNPACLEFTGLSLDKVVGSMICKDIFKSDLCQAQCAIQQAMKTKKPVVGKWVKVIDRNKREHTIVVNAGALIDTNGEVLGGFEIWRDAMSDMELASRINSFLETLNNYCYEMNRLIDTFKSRISPGLLKNVNNRRMLDDMKYRTNNLATWSNSLFNSYCWDMMNCPPERRVQCPAFPNSGGSCWDIDYTWCDGQMQGKAVEKKNKCTSCSVYKNFRKGNGYA